MKCKRCDGTGSIITHHKATHMDPPEDFKEDCPSCNGTGKERQLLTADEVAYRERAQDPRIGYPGAEQMMRWQRDYK